MSLTNIEYGSLASSAVLNNNFSYLDNSITSLSASAENSISAVNSAIETINTTLVNTATSLNSKIDVDLSNMNANATAKNAIIGWGMPDYSAGVAKTFETTYTADTDCFVIVSAAHTTQAVYANLAIRDSNDNDLAVIRNSGANVSGMGYHASLCVFVPKGYKYLGRQTGANTSNVGTYVACFPLKGAS